MECVTVEWNARCLVSIATDIAKKILLGRRYDEPLFIYSRFKVPWSDHLVSYFSLMYRYGINENILHLTFFSCKILIISDKMLIITGISNETRNELTLYATLC